LQKLQKLALVMTSESARVSDFSPHVFFAVKSHLWAHSCYDWWNFKWLQLVSS